VVALSNRADQGAAKITFPVAALLPENEFFSFAMLATRAAHAAGYAKSVAVAAPPAALFTVRDIADARGGASFSSPLVSVDTGTVVAQVDAGDTKLFVLSPTPSG
jgi:hypothetical protein